MNSLCPVHEHVNRRAFLKGTLVTGAGVAVANWGHLFHSSAVAAETAKKYKHCILLWMNGGASQIDTFDMKPGQPSAGPFRPIASRVTGIQVCEYLPKIAEQTGKLAIIRSMNTSSPDHPDGIYQMHTGYKMGERVPHPEIGAMIAKYAGSPQSDLPSFVRMAPHGNAGSGYLGPRYQPVSLERNGQLPAFTSPYLASEAEQRRSELLRSVEEGFAQEHKADPFEAHRLAKEKPGGWCAPSRSSTSARNGRATASVTATATSAAVACWPASWSRPAWPSSRWGTASTTAMPTTSRATRWP